jgi:hypothetical protein
MRRGKVSATTPPDTRSSSTINKDADEGSAAEPAEHTHRRLAEIANASSTGSASSSAAV